MFPVEMARQARDTFEAAGAIVHYREIDDLSHPIPSKKILRLSTVDELSMPEVQIVDYEVVCFYFASLNYQWITEYYVEEEDRKALDDPEGYAIKPGGNIFFLLEAELRWARLPWPITGVRIEKSCV